LICDFVLDPAHVYADVDVDVDAYAHGVLYLSFLFVIACYFLLVKIKSP